MPKKRFTEDQLKLIKNALAAANPTSKPIDIATALKKEGKFEEHELNKIAKKVGEIRRKESNKMQATEPLTKKQKKEKTEDRAKEGQIESKIDFSI